MKNNTENIIAKFKTIHGNKYDYSKVYYTKYRSKVQVKCNLCNFIFHPTPSNHILGSGCPNCGQSYNRNKKLKTEDFIRMSISIHGDEYDYSQSVYVNAKTKVKIICKKCKLSFSQLPRGHIYEESGCPNCKKSHGETKISKLLTIMNLDFRTQHTFPECLGTRGRVIPFDFYIPSLNTCIEFDGKQHYDKTSKFYSEDLIKNDITKNKFCESNNIRLIRISFRQIDEIEKKLKSWIFSL